MYEQYENPRPGQEPPYRPSRHNGNSLGSAALICAILGIVLCCTFYGGVVLGGLAIVLGLLSRGGRKHAVPPGKGAIYIGLASVCLSVLILTVSFITVIHQFGSIENFLNAYMNTLNSYL